MAAYDKQRESKSKNIINLAADIFARDPNKGTKSGISTADAISQAKEFYNEFKTIPETKVPDAALPIVPSKRPLSDFDRK